MITIGLTGSIGMGKSTTARMFQEAGVPVHDADAQVHAIYAPGGAAVGPVGDAFPGTVKDGAVDREALRKAVLGDPEALKKLNSVVHPLLAQGRADFLARVSEAGEDLILFDIPLLYETGGETRVDVVVVASAPPQMQRERVLAREGMTPARLDAILAQQMPDAEKRQRADFIVDTGKGLEAARGQVAQIVADLRERARRQAAAAAG